MPIVTYPVDPESWSENIVSPEGFWYSAVYNGQVFRDIVYKQFGEASIRHEGGDGANDGSIIFQLNSPFDLTNKTDAKITFYLKLSNGAVFTGVCWVQLVNPDGLTWATKQFGTTPAGPFELKEYDVGPGTGWSEDAGFDWSNISQIRITADGWGPFWVDRIYFSWVVSLPTLKILSQPSGKQFNIDEAVSGATPAQYQVTPDTPYTVSIEPSGFVEWENGSINPVRNVTLAEGEVKTITAYYEGAPPPDGEDRTLLLVAGTLLSIGLIILVKII